MENACVLCFNLVAQNKPHPALKKISAIADSELYKCCCCYAYLHKFEDKWEVISGGNVESDDGMVVDADLEESFSFSKQKMLAANG